MVRVKLVLLLAVFAAIFISCSDSPRSFTSSQATPRVQQIMPLQVGNSWTYETISVRTGPNTRGVTDTTIRKYGITQDTMIAGQRWFQYEMVWSSDSLDKASTILLYSIHDSALWYGFGKSGSMNAYVAAKYPVQVGDTFSIPSPYDYFAKVISIDSTISVLAGNLKSIHTRFNYKSNGQIRQNVFYSPGVGLVYGEIWPIILGKSEDYLSRPPDIVISLMKFEPVR